MQEFRLIMLLLFSTLCILLPQIQAQLDDVAIVRGLLDQIQLETIKKVGIFDAEVTPKVFHQ